MLLLFVALCVARCWLLVVCCWLFGVRCLLCVASLCCFFGLADVVEVCRELGVACCVLFVVVVVCCVMSIGCLVLLCVVGNSLCVVRWALLVWC